MPFNPNFTWINSLLYVQYICSMWRPSERKKRILFILVDVDLKCTVRKIVGTFVPILRYGIRVKNLEGVKCQMMEQSENGENKSNATKPHPLFFGLCSRFHLQFALWEHIKNREGEAEEEKAWARLEMCKRWRRSNKKKTTTIKHIECNSTSVFCRSSRGATKLFQ